MTINSLPSGIQSTIQQDFLEHAFYEPLDLALAYRDVADKEEFKAGIGETITKTRRGLLVANTTPMAAASSSDLTSGLTDQDFTVEQFTLSLGQWGSKAETNIVTEGVAIEKKFLGDAKGLGKVAGQVVDRLARNALFVPYMGGNTRVTYTGGANTQVKVDSITGFNVGDTVVFGGSDSYTIANVVADATNVSTLTFTDGSAMAGVSGTLVFTANVTSPDNTAGVSVVDAKAPLVLRPYSNTNVMIATTGALVPGNTLQAMMIINAVAALRDNNVPDVDGLYNIYLSYAQMAGLQLDPVYQNYAKTNISNDSFRKGFINEGLGVRFIHTTEAPLQNGISGKSIRRAIIAGQGAIIESDFTATGYANQAGLRDSSNVMVKNGIAHVVRGPLDALQQWVTQSYSYIGGFVAPTDTGTNNQVMPTASNAAYKRAVVLESL